ncbi:nuclear transport factor 2 family protein [Streptomyces mayteni]
MIHSARPVGVLTQEAVHRLVTRMVTAAGRHDVEAMVSCLASHGLVLSLPGRVLRGPGEVGDWYRGLTRRHRLRCRLTSPPEIRLTSPLHAECRADLTLSSHRRGRPGPADRGGRPHALRLTLSTVLQRGGPRIRTCDVEPLVGSPAATPASLSQT